ncbi:MAG: TonB family protein / TonB-dependent receptor, partial [Myxococcales bacterium]|nr:TonB family protein / TonB-dependent receptor [Myxococcales bacterium]
MGRFARHLWLLLSICAPCRVWAQPTVSPAAAAAFEPARLIHSVLPVAPHLEPGDQIDVVLVLDVDATGHVTRVTVSEPGGEAFDRAAETAARQFAFAPARMAGRPVAVQVTYRSRFVGPPRAAA